MPHSPSIELARDLIRLESITPDDGGCQTLLSQRLTDIGFQCEQINFHDVSNLWATRKMGNDNSTKPLLVFAGHTDVVPTGPLDHWSIPPFDGKIVDGVLHGRGAADMKSSIACFVTACERFIKNHESCNGTIGLLITSDEEGIATWGTRAVIDELNSRDISIDMCIVGEPTSVDQLGDTVKVGRRGSINGNLVIRGKQGHIAYPHLAINPLHTALPALIDLTTTQWDQGNENFQPTSFQISNINGGTGASNVIPGEIHIDFNFRYSTETTDVALIEKVENIVRKHDLKFRIKWSLSGYPFETKMGKLVEAVSTGIAEITGRSPVLSTTGGTSDGRFIAPTGAQVVELGPSNATIHQIDEQVKIADLDLLSECYEIFLVKLLAT